MSGGIFDYHQFKILEIADRIEEEIENATKPRPNKVKEVKVAVYFHDLDGYYNREYYNSYKTFDIAIKELKSQFRLKLHAKTKKSNDGLRERTYEVLSYYNRIKCRYVTIKEYIYEHYPLDDSGIEPYYPNYNEETIATLITAVIKLRIAFIYAHRIDWLLSGDDGEDDMQEQIQKQVNEELSKLFSKYKY